MTKELSFLQLGCGKKPLAGFVNLDLEQHAWVDVVHDMDKYPWPFEDNRFEMVYANSVLEHITDLIHCFSEIHRILMPDGILKGGVPWYNYGGAFGDPTHKQFFTKTTFQYLTKGSQYSYCHKTGIWEIVKLEVTPTRWGKVIPFKNKLLSFIGGFVGNIVHKINFELKAVKE
jgi:SAM-dependent methyltransferase